MGMFWIAIVLVVAIILGNLMILFRTAKKPKIPDSVKPKPYKDDDENW
jgi:NADH:ubiquinone oxidoreductase subunit 3 (subunit A)